MKWNSSLVLTAGLLAPSVSWAGACCVGSTSSMPTRLGECEKVLVGLTGSGEISNGRWDSQGALQSSSVRETSVSGSLGAGFRLHREWQLGVSAPVMVRNHHSESLGGWGGGMGDVRALVLWDPIDEMPSTDERRGRAVPLLTAGLRAPTGRDWTESSTSLHEDVTGLQGPAAIAGVGIERTLDTWPWGLYSTAEVGFTGVAVQPSISTVGSVGRYLGTHWTVLGMVNHTVAWAALEGVKPTMNTSVGAKLVRGNPVQWRGWLSAQTSVPLPGAGLTATRNSSVGLGYLLVR